MLSVAAHVFDYAVVYGFWLGLPGGLLYYSRRENRRDRRGKC